MKYTFCFDDNIDIEELADFLEEEYSVKLKANNSSDTVHGYINRCYYPQGQKHGLCWSFTDLSKIQSAHTCFEIVFYEFDSDPEILKDSNGKPIKDKRGLEVYKDDRRTFFRKKIVPKQDLISSIEKFRLNKTSKTV